MSTACSDEYPKYYPLLERLPEFRSTEFLRLAEGLLYLCFSLKSGKIHDLSLQNIKTDQFGFECKLADCEKTVSLPDGEIPFWFKRNAKDSTQGATFDPEYAVAAIMLKSLCAEDALGIGEMVRTATEKITFQVLDEPLRAILIEAMKSVISGEKGLRRAIFDAKRACCDYLVGESDQQSDGSRDDAGRLSSEREGSTDDRESDESPREKSPPTKQKPYYPSSYWFIVQ